MKPLDFLNSNDIFFSFLYFQFHLLNIKESNIKEKNQIYEHIKSLTK